MIILNGIKGLLASKKGVMSLLMLGTIGGLAATNHLDASVAACLAVVQGIYCWTAAKTDVASMSARGQ